jgi:alpha-glucosidase
MDQPWWQQAVIYQVYIRSFADSDGDGVGDLRGVIDGLEYLDWLGVDAVWLSPITVSPDRDWGYDVADYRDVQPAFGSLADFDELVARARDRGMRIVVDLVPNHTSDRHPWFVDAGRSRTALRRDWYIWADRRPDGSPPNNWRSTFGKTSAWRLSTQTGQLYLYSFLAHPDVRRASEDLRSGTYERLPAPDSVWAFRRGAATVVAVNLSDHATALEGHQLRPWEGLVLE